MINRNRSGRILGFSFLEIMMVVMIIGILVAVVGPKLVGRTRRAQVAAAKDQIKSFETSLQMYEMEVGSFPSTEQGLDALVNKPSNVSKDAWTQAMKEIPADPWKEPYIYRCPGEHGGEYDLVSKGPDTKEGTEDDVNNYPKSAKK